MDWLIFIAIAVFVLHLWSKRNKRLRIQQSAQTSLRVDLDPTRAPVTVISSRSRRPERRTDARWLPKDQPTTIAGVLITRGFLYIGSSLPTQSGFGDENCLVNPTLQIAHAPIDFREETMAYWPSYSTISPAARRAYLTWLATDRDDPQTYVGFVFLYFYGLERRLLFDSSGNEAPLLYAEIVRLLSVYGHNKSFRRYATVLLDAARLKNGLITSTPDLVSDRSVGEIPFGVRAAIGQMLSQGRALDAEWALAWYLAHPETRLRTVVRRCFHEFVDLFRIRFATEFPNGMNVSIPRRRLRPFGYRAASSTFSVTIRGEFEKWPDIVSLTAPQKQIAMLVERCAADLESYSRLSAKANNTVTSFETAAALPSELLGTDAAKPLKALRDWLDAQITSTVGRISLTELQAQLSPSSSDPTSKRFLSNVSAILGKLGYGMEPDPRFGGPAPQSDARIVVFRASDGASIERVSPDYLLARLHVELGILVANADERFAPEQISWLTREIKEKFNFERNEQVRVLGYLMYLMSYPPTLRILSKLKTQTSSIRRDCARLAIAIAGASGSLSSNEMRLLERIYRALDLPGQNLYSDLHSFGVDEQIVTISTGEPAEGAPIPPRPKEATVPMRTVALDRDRLSRVRADTKRVAKILDSVFSADADEPIAVTVPELQQEHTEGAATVDASPEVFSGLDIRYVGLLVALKDADSITRSSFDSLARKHQLLPNGAIETINEWSYQRFGEPLLDDGDPVEIAHHLLVLQTQANEAVVQ